MKSHIFLSYQTRLFKFKINNNLFLVSDKDRDIPFFASEWNWFGVNFATINTVARPGGSVCKSA